MIKCKARRLARVLVLLTRNCSLSLFVIAKTSRENDNQRKCNCKNPQNRVRATRFASSGPLTEIAGHTASLEKAEKAKPPRWYRRASQHYYITPKSGEGQGEGEGCPIIPIKSSTEDEDEETPATSLRWLRRGGVTSLNLRSYNSNGRPPRSGGWQGMAEEAGENRGMSP